MGDPALLLGIFVKAHIVPFALIILAGIFFSSKDFRSFVRAVGEHWATLMSGVLGLLATGIAQIRGADISFSDYIAIALFAVVWACFLAWKKERDELAKFKFPQLRGELTWNSTAPAGSNDQNTFMTIRARLTNPFGPPAALANFSMSLNFPDGRIIQGRIPILPTSNVRLGAADRPGYEVILQPSDFLPSLTNTPIPAGGMANGWFWAVFEGVTREDLRKLNASVVVKFTDVVSEQSHQIEKQINQTTPMDIFDITDIQRRYSPEE